MPVSLSHLTTTMQSPLRAFIYDRNSRVSKRGSTSTSDQSAENRRWCDENRCAVAAAYSDPGRGATRHSKASRPDFDAMMARLEGGIRRGQPHAECDIIVVWAASRAARSLDVYVQLRSLCVRGGILFAYNGTIYDLNDGHDRRTTGADFLQAEGEGETIRDGILRTTRANAQRGRPHGPVPFGYRREYDPQTGELLGQVVYEPEAVILREIAQRIASGQSCRSIAADLNRRGVRTPRGNAWGNGNVVRNMMIKPTYLGRRTHNGETLPAAWKPVFRDDAEVAAYLACVRILTEPGRAGAHSTQLRYLLPGIAYCGLCGREPLSPLQSVKRPGGDVAYRCGRCFGAVIPVQVYDDVVVSAVIARLESPDLLRALVATVGEDGSAMSRALAEAGQLEQQLAEARQLAATVRDGRMALSAASLASLEEALVPLIEAARLRARDASVPPVLYEVAGPDAGQRWEGLDLLQQREVIRALVRPFLLRAPARGVRGQRALDPDRFEWDWLR